MMASCCCNRRQTLVISYRLFKRSLPDVLPASGFSQHPLHPDHAQNLSVRYTDFGWGSHTGNSFDGAFGAMVHLGLPSKCPSVTFWASFVSVTVSVNLGIILIAASRLGLASQSPQLGPDSSGRVGITPLLPGDPTPFGTRVDRQER